MSKTEEVLPGPVEPVAFYDWQCNERQSIPASRADIEWLTNVADAYDSIPVALTGRGGFVFVMMPVPIERPN